MRIERRWMIGLLLLAACGEKPKADGVVDKYALTGEVTHVDGAAKSATIRHEAIKDASGKEWMAAMTMEFPVKEAADLAKMAPGVKIRATLYQKPKDLEFWVGDVQVVP